MNENELKILQERYTTLIEELKKIKSQIKSSKHRLKNGKIVPDKLTYGIFYDLSYYSHFDGHKSGAVYDYEHGAVESNEKDFEFIKNAIETNNVGEEEELWLTLEDVPFDHLEIPDNKFSQDERQFPQ